MPNSIQGFKCFNKGLITRFGNKMTLNQLYTYPNNPHFSQSGYHFCTHIEDTFRYFDTRTNNVDVCEVTGYPQFSKMDDEYNGYYDMYSCQSIIINRILTREEIIEMSKKMSQYSIIKLIKSYCLTQEELTLFMQQHIRDYDIMFNLIFYYYDRTISTLNHEEAQKRIDYYTKGLGKTLTSQYIKKI